MWHERPGLQFSRCRRHHRRGGISDGLSGRDLWPLFGPPVTSLAGFAFMLPALIGFSSVGLRERTITFQKSVDYFPATFD